MDHQKLTELLRATIDPNPEQRKAAEDQLAQIRKIIGFVPTILQIVMNNNVDQPVRQAGAVYLKNMISSNWADHEVQPGEPIPFSIHEQDRAMIRSSIVDAIVHSPELLRVQLAVCLNCIIKNDFPGRWPQVVDNISIYLQNPDVKGWNGALITMYQLVKTYEYKRSEERAPLNEAMNLLLPMIYQLMVNLMNDPSEASVLMQKQILKIYYALTQFSLPLDLITKETFSQWMEICRQIAERPVPDCSHLDDDEKPEFAWWKTKKWALHIMVRMFERYGSPRNVISDKYQKFAEWYLPTFTQGVLDVLLKILDQYRNNIYVSPRVLTDVLAYIKNAVSHAFSWKLIKPHMVAIIQDVLFPIMSFSDQDQELWETDPHEYIKLKFDIFEDYATPVPAAQSLLHSCCKKRKGILPKAMTIIMQIITSPNADNKQKDGALHMIGTLADVLLKKRIYRDQVENMLTTYVFPEFQNSAGHMRARACWVLHYFSEIQLKNPQILAEIIRLTTHSLLNDQELPVKVEAAIGLQMFLSCQDGAAQYCEAQIKEITKELLTIIRETENEDLTNVLQKIVCTFSEQLLPVAIEICQHLATTFSHVLEAEDGGDEKAITAMGLLNTIETLLTVMEDHPEVMSSLHPIVINVVGHIFQNNITDFYEETFSLVYDLTSKTISPEMWQMLELIYQVFQKGGMDYFVDMMPALHNYVTIDTPAFLSDPVRLLAMFEMCKTMLTSNPGEDHECHAAKLLEVIILQCKGQIDSVIPVFVELALGRLTREVQSSELRTMCLQVVIAALYYNPQLLLSILDKMSQQNNEPISSHFIKQWIHDTDCFLGIHDRKLCVLGLCTLISLGDSKPQVLSEVSSKIIPSLILLFDGLTRAYESRAQEEEEEEEEENDDCEEALSSDEDEIDEFAPDYLEKLAEFSKAKASEAGFEMKAEIKDDEDEDDEDEEDSIDELNETALEGFTTPIDDEEDENAIDEFVTFKNVITALSTQDQAWYALLTSGLTPEQAKALQDVVTTADQRKAAKESKLIEKRGGFAFTQQTVPSTFKFGS
ncbi:importin-7 [Stomoxys calcitrans]|uniref:Importin N-terminal domain-containing protein n=1 Tax=Stomoxys calcitrans TaxID=35570 RepID=A0A1I8NX42_STOCA|nr:importin-7 [Stomoxys calcitrans]